MTPDYYPISHPSNSKQEEEHEEESGIISWVELHQDCPLNSKQEKEQESGIIYCADLLQDCPSNSKQEEEQEEESGIISWADLHQDCPSNSKQEEEQEEESGILSWADLHKDCLELVLSNLYGSDLSNFYATCRSWQSVTTYFPPPSRSALSRVPYLMSLNDNHCKCKFFQPLSNGINYEELPELKGAKIRFSNFGWLLMSEGTQTRFFYNPCTREEIQLPLLPWGNNIVKEYFSAPPTSSDCVVVGFLLSDLNNIEFGIIRRGEDKWSFWELEGNQHFLLSDDGIVSDNGKLYCLGEAGNIGELDLGGKKMSWTIRTKPLSRWQSRKYRQSFMVKCDGGGMLAVFVPRGQQPLVVKRFCLTEMTWQDVPSLGDEALYLSRGGCFLVKGLDKAMANKIYFPKFHGRSGVFYSLETHKYHSVAGSFSSKSCVNFIDEPSSCWIKVSDDYLEEDLTW